MTATSTVRTPLNQYAPTTVSEAPPERIASLDVVRGVIMILMAIDHVRVYAGVPAGGATPALFFTRWVTHFSAPGFAFLAGTGAFLLGRKLERRALARYLVTRGLFLVLLEMTVLRFAWTFNFDYAHYMLAGVIWMLGWCMVLLAAMLPLGTRAIGVIGVVIMAGQSLLRPLAHASPNAMQWIWQLFYLGGPLQTGDHGTPLFVLYNIVPWIGVMMAGYAFGTVMARDRATRARLCSWIGLSATGLFIVLGTLSALRGSDGGGAPLLFRVLSQNKYRDSQLFLLMTLGPMIALIPLAERAHGAIGKVLSTFGRVPLFFYLMHIPLIHLLACAVSRVREGSVNAWLIANHPVAPPEPLPGYAWSLPLLYLIFCIAIAALYFPCRWYARLKATREYAWMSYV